MVKQRFSSADVAAEVACLRSRCLGMRVANVYDINPRTYVLKLARSGEDADKVLLLIESGTRFHTVQAMPEKADTPSNFTLKLRKHIRTRRLEAVKQLGVDRIVQMTFGSGPAACHLLLEFYAQGNVILADDKFEVLTLLRSHRDDAKGVAIMARHPYPIHTIHLRQPLSPQALQAALQAAAPDATLKGCVGSLLPYGPTVSEHCVLAASLDPQRLPAADPLTAAEQAALVAGVRQWEAWLDSCEDSQAPPQGYILTKPPPALAAAKGAAPPPPGDGGSEAAPAPAAGGVEGSVGAAGHPELYEGFEPAQLHQHRGKPCLHFPTFDAALEDFFGKIQGQRSALQQAAKEKAAVGKLEAVRRDHEKRLGSLGQEAEAAELKAALIEYNLGPVDAALASVREAVGSGMDWRDLARMVKEERRAGNPVAGLIDSLQLDKGRVTLLLSNWLDEEDGDDEAATRPATKVEVDLELSAHANARAYYDSRRKHQVKHQKTLDANHKAIKAAEKKAVAQLKQVQRGAAAPVISRKPFWWERFHWFISSENYLVLSGRDAQQNELLVKRYMRKGDAYVHADLHGASSTVVKNHTPLQPIPPLTLSQAGQACVCRSQAWAAKVVTSAWWVHPEQVSRTAPTGEYLVTGSFMIRGRKNYLPPQPLVMGFGYLFGLAEESVPAHLGERAPRLRDCGEAAAEAAEGGHQEAGSSGGEEEQEEEEEEDEQQQQQQVEGEASTAAQPSALEAFLDASADTVAGGGASAASAATLRRGSSTAGSGSTAAGAADALTASFHRYGLSSDTHESAGAAAAAEAAAEQEQEGEGERAGEAAGSSTRRHLSAKERQLKKKQQQGKAPQPQAAHQQQQQAAGSSGGAKKPVAQQQQEMKAGQQAAAVEAAPKARSGGAKGGKGKGGKHKYSEQDEEDRLLAQQLLQSGGTKKDRKQRKEERKERVAARKADRTGLSKQENTAEDIAKLTARPTAAPGSGGGTEDEGQASQGSDAGTDSDAGSQHSEQQQQQQQQAAPAEGDHAAAPEAPAADAAAAHTAAVDEHAAQGVGGAGEEAAAGDDDSDSGGDGDEGGDGGEGEGEGEGGAEGSGGVDDAAEVAALLRGEQLEVLGDEERDKLTQLDQLTGQPRESDVLLFALPVCAPYQVLAPYKLRVKLIPGTLKKGKAVRQAAELLLKGGEVSQRERDLIRAVPEPEAITCLCGTVKIQSAGLLKMKQAQKKGKGKK